MNSHNLRFWSNLRSKEVNNWFQRQLTFNKILNQLFDLFVCEKKNKTVKLGRLKFFYKELVVGKQFVPRTFGNFEVEEEKD